MKLFSLSEKPGRTMLAVGLAVAVAAAGCSTPTDSTSGTQMTETFSGTVNATSGATNVFTVGAAGQVDVTLTALTPQTTITMGMGIGTGSSTSCTLQLFSENVKIGTVVSGTIGTPGAYCVAVYDIGNVTTSVNYTITVAHP